MKKFSVYKDSEQWSPFNWFWVKLDKDGNVVEEPGVDALGHGGFLFKWWAYLDAWIHTK